MLTSRRSLPVCSSHHADAGERYLNAKVLGDAHLRDGGVEQRVEVRHLDLRLRQTDGLVEQLHSARQVTPLHLYRPQSLVREFAPENRCDNSETRVMAGCDTMHSSCPEHLFPKTNEQRAD